jgi:hypothetical protein
MENTMMHVVLAGSFKTGIDVIGPFNDGGEAVDWASEHCINADYWEVTSIDAPTDWIEKEQWED